MAVTAPPALTLPGLSPDRSDRTTFAARSIARDDYIKNVQVPQLTLALANVAANATDTATNATAAATSATTATAQGVLADGNRTAAETAAAQSLTNSVATALSRLDAINAATAAQTSATAAQTSGSAVALQNTLAASGGASAVGFLQSGIGAVARTVQGKESERVSVKDFGAKGDGVTNDAPAFTAAGSSFAKLEVEVYPGVYLLNTIPAPTGNVTWVLHKGVTLAGSGTLPGAIINYGALTNNWVKDASGGIYSYLEDSSALNIHAKPSGAGVFAAARSSMGGGTSNDANLGINAFAYNDKTTGTAGVWGFYSTVLKAAGVAGPTHGMEIDVANMGATAPLFPFAMFAAGQSEGIWICTGGETSNVASVGTASCALAIVQNDSQTVKTAKFDKGIIFHSQAISGTDGITGSGTAIAMAKGHQVVWFNSANQVTSFVRSDASVAASGQALIFSDFGTLVSDITSGIAVLQIGTVANVANRIVLNPSATGAPVQVNSDGADANIDLAFFPKGTGVLRYGAYVAGSVTQTGYITIKDAGGTIRRLLVG